MSRTPLKKLLMLLLVFAGASTRLVDASSMENFEIAGFRSEQPRPVLDPVITPLSHSQHYSYLQNYSQNNQLKAKSDVIAEVKRRYGATVLKISLNKQRQLYEVRVLMPNGKVRKLQISAKR